MDLSLPLQSPAGVFAVLLAIVLVVPLLAERLRVPGVVGLILAGALVGEHTTGLLAREGTIALLGSAGLLYLMFVAGLELDLDQFAEQRGSSLVFGVLTFAWPMGVGTVVMRAMGFDWLPAILLASCWASHTLLAYPIYRHHGTQSHPAVATAVGGTILTDTAALIVLVVVARAHGGVLDAGFWLSLVPSFVLLVVASTWALPRIGRWFFAGIGQDRAVRFLFVMVALFASASLAQMVGVEAIIGAFLAGIGLNRLVPNGSRLMERIEFLGSQLLIPIFLVSVGMLVDPRVLRSPSSLGVAAGFTAVALGAKWLAAASAGQLLGYGRAEIGTLFSLSAAQAAATLAAVVVGLRVGLLQTQTVSAVVVVILVTCVLTSWTASRYAPRLSQQRPRRPLGATIVVPIARPESAEPLLRLAARLARPDGGTVLPLVVVGSETSPQELVTARTRALRAERLADRQGVEAHAVTRIDASAEAGVLHTVVERAATAVVMGWRGYASRREALFGGIADVVTQGSSAPVLLARTLERRYRRVLVLLDDEVGDPVVAASTRLALWAAGRLAAADGLPIRVVVTVDDPALDRMVQDTLGVVPRHEARKPAVAVQQHATVRDLVVVAGRPDGTGIHGTPERVARSVPRCSVVVAVATLRSLATLDAGTQVHRRGAASTPRGDGDPSP